MLTYNSNKANSLDTDQKERIHHGIRVKRKYPSLRMTFLDLEPKLKKFLDLFTSYFWQVDNECEHS